MKKVIIPFIFLLCLLFSSCSSAVVKPHLGGIAFRGEITYFNEKYSLEGQMGEDKTLKAKITAPKELSDLIFTITEKETMVEYKGITYSPVEGAMPFSALMDRFYKAMTLGQAEGLTADSDGKLTIENDGRKITFFLSPTGLPQKAEIENSNFVVNFYNVSIKEDNDG